MKWGVEFTYPALLAGLWSLLAMLDVLQHYEVDERTTDGETLRVRP
jgi:hypothetical protein